MPFGHAIAIVTNSRAVATTFVSKFIFILLSLIGSHGTQADALHALRLVICWDESFRDKDVFAESCLDTLDDSKIRSFVWYFRIRINVLHIHANHISCQAPNPILTLPLSAAKRLRLNRSTKKMITSPAFLFLATKTNAVL